MGAKIKLRIEMRVFLTLTVLTALYSVGVLLFTGGFLLRRIVISSNSTCNSASDKDTSHLDNDCITKARYKRAVIVVIDALRYDFVRYNYLENLAALSFQNKFKKIASLIKEKPENSRLYRFLADPPTTTLQRLKGLTTGSLPTFVDAGSNFGKTEISEDNFIDQLRSFNRSIVFMGDDTWTGLYPGRFARSFPYPSFNVKDLHTVDDGVVSHLIPELMNGEWDVLIAHLLGVDHCGHTFGPDHPAMRDKLVQMDDLVDKVVKNLDEETVLFVLGDHGMTKTGDHGGDSREELEAALFVYSPKNLGPTREDDGDATVSQVDLVASISLLLGLPIPYQNLGVVIPDLFRSCEDGECRGRNDEIEKELNYLAALNLNALQVRRYLVAYAGASQDVEPLDLERLNSEFEKVASEHGRATMRASVGDYDLDRLVTLQSEFRRCMLSARTMLKKKWAQFDVPAMFCGAGIFVIALLINICLVCVQPFLFSLKSLLFVSASCVVSLCFFCCGFHVTSLFLFFSAILILLFQALSNLLPTKILLSKIYDAATSADVLSAAVWVVYVASLFSNSFIVHEGSVTSFLLQSCFYIQLVSSILDHSRSIFPGAHKNSKKSPLNSTTRNSILFLIIFALVANFSLSFSKAFHSCREEQTNCRDSWIVRSQLEDAGFFGRNVLLLSIFLVLSIYFATCHWLKKNGNLNGDSLYAFVCRYVMFASSLMLATYWCLKAIAVGRFDSLSLYVAKSVYLFSFFSVATVVVRPLCTFVVRREPPPARDSLNSAILNDILLDADSSKEIVPRIFQRLRANWRIDRTEDDPKIYIYGLPTVVSSPLVALLLAVSIPLTMLLGMSASPSMFLLIVALFCILEFHSLRARLDSKKTMSDVPMSSIVLMLLLSCERFYSFGHQPTIASVRWEAAYHGFEGNFEFNAIPALLVSLNTFASQVVVSLALPLLVYWPLTRGFSVCKQDSNGKVNSLHSNGDHDTDDKSYLVKGEFVICEEGDGATVMSQLCLKTLLLVALKLFGLMACVAVHRRHLMVWKIFAPRFIYETVSFFLVSAACVFNYLFFLRTRSVVNRFVSNLK